MKKGFSIIIKLSIALLLIAQTFSVVVLANAVPLPIRKTTRLPNIVPRKINKPTSAPQDLLSTTYYLRTCPNFEGIIQQKVRDWINKDYTLAASIIRLHFHDCAVRKLGLNVVDLVALSGAHTIGRCTCDSIRQRINGPTTITNVGLDVGLWNYLKKQCRNVGVNNFVNLDATTPRTFDEVYYKNIELKKGLLLTDQLLNFDERTAPLVAVLASQPQIFFSQFAASMVNLGNVQVITGNDKNGEIRLNCNFVNK
ncbi:OLC1v1025016C1 [Oldenlandia corymbosa var. corymbosa]|uniref:peroxidase n=1 Tax=Oldenlandia corymbosa var. corymbosa TaxID=529605 RepID=A0AAV1C543_OLDCO|nr:OLC1v1025016C1 [Oldenlandia corymbosa var. corymbosa]